jgi:hypothetical protein
MDSSDEELTMWRTVGRMGGLIVAAKELAAGVVVALVLMAAGTAARAATITVATLNDTSAMGDCSLRDAITTANGTSVSGCTSTTDPSNTIQFSMAGTISLGSTLPTITRDLTITGPTTSPGITIDGGGKAQLIQMAPGATLNLQFLTLAHGSVTGSGGSAFGSSAFGGAIDNEGTLSVANSTFSANHATGGAGTTIGGSGFGGAILNNGTLTITNSTFSENQATGADTVSGGQGGDGVGGAIQNSGTLSVANSTFSANQATGVAGGEAIGGAIYSVGTLTVTNSTFSANHAPGIGGIGGAIENNGGASSGRLIVTNSTFSGNQAGFSGGAIDTEGATATSHLKGSIFASSTGGNCANISGTITDAGYNISDDTSCGFTKTGSANNGDGVNPLLATAGLASNGGPTQTIALQSTSPAIDAIPVASCTDQATPTPNALTTDQRGFARPDNGESACDIGAFELGEPFATFTGKLDVTVSTGSFELNSSFTLGAGSNGINPVAEKVTLQIGPYSVTIPAGSFKKNKGAYVFSGVINGASLDLRINPTGGSSFTLQAEGSGANLTGISNPVTVTLTIGDDSGSTQITAQIS